MSREILIHLDNVKSKVIDVKAILMLRDELKLRSPNAFYSPAFRARRWDGFIRYVTDTGTFDTGHLPMIINHLKDKGYSIKIRDLRDEYNKGKLAKELEGMTLRPYQLEAVKSIITNKIENTYFPRGIIKAATNAGKNLIIAATIKSMPKDWKFIILLKEKEWYETSLDEIPKLLPGEVGFIDSKKEEWNRVMICMAPTLFSRIPKYKAKLSQFNGCFIDECELSTNKTFKTILGNLYNCILRVGLSGSALLGKLKKDEIKKRELKAYFGDMLFEISNKDLIEMGHSSDVKVIINKGSEVSGMGSYQDEYEQGVVKDKERNRLIIKRINYWVSQEFIPILVIVKRHKHLKILTRRISKKFPRLKVEGVHHETPNRKDIVHKFKEGKIDILIGSHILKRAKNFPLIRVLINASAGDSQEDVLQILGRATRKHESKEYTILEDFMDNGTYLTRHSKHRLKYYKSEGLSISLKY